MRPQWLLDAMLSRLTVPAYGDMPQYYLPSSADVVEASRGHTYRLAMMRQRRPSRI